MRKNAKTQRISAYQHYKMYKNGKKWVFASLTALGMGLSLVAGPNLVQADTTDVPTEQVATPEADPMAPMPKEPVTPALVTKEKSIAGSETPADVPADTPVTEPEPSDSEKPTEPVGDLNDTYTAAQNQTDTANQGADEANASLASLQALLQNQDLTSLPDWQDQLQTALTDFQNKSAAFGDTTATTDATVATYQAAIDAVISSQPNAVESVTQGDETTGTTLTDYDRIVADYKDQVANQLAVIQNNVHTYDRSEAVNAAQTELATAATQLNKALDQTETTADQLTQLKSVYDAALSTYNQAVTDYDAVSTTKANPVETNDAGETEATKNPSDAAFGQYLQYLNTKAEYKNAMDKYGTASKDATDLAGKLATWQTTVSDYNAALKTIQDAQVKATDDTAINKATQAVSDAVTIVNSAKTTYDELYSSDDVDRIMSEGGRVAKTLADATNAVKDRINDWKSAQDQYLQQVQANSAVTTTLPDLNTLGEKVTTAQDAVQVATDTLKTSQADYQTALDAYQAALTKGGSTQTATNGTMPDLTDLQSNLDETFHNNTAVMTKADQLLAVKQTEMQLQQRINLINDLVTGMNNNQAVWTNLSNAANSTDVNGISQWSKLTDSFKTVGTAFQAISAVYGTAIIGDSEDTPSYQALTDLYQTALTAYDGTTGTYTTADELEKSYDDFSQKLADFNTAFDKMIAALEENAPNPVFNEQASKNMEDMASLSTTGDKTKEVTEIEGGYNINIYAYYGDNLDFFLNNRSLRLNSVLPQNLLYTIQGQDNILTDSEGNPIPMVDADGNPLATIDMTVPMYTRLVDSKRAEVEQTLRKDILPTYSDGIDTYQLTGVMVPGQVTTTGGLPVSRDDYYVFTSADPMSEFMDIFTGVGSNVNTNTQFKFYYTKITSDVAKTNYDVVTGAPTEVVPVVTMPMVESIHNLTPVQSDSALGAGPELGTLPTVNGIVSEALTKFHEGTPVSMNWTVSIDQAPQLNLNHVTKPQPSRPVYNGDFSGVIGFGELGHLPKTGTDDSDQPGDSEDINNPEISTNSDGNGTKDPNIDPSRPEQGSDSETEGNVAVDNTNTSREGQESNNTDFATNAVTQGMVGQSQMQNLAFGVTNVTQTVTNTLGSTASKTSLGTLPQTGERQNQRKLQTAGITLLSVGALMGLATFLFKKQRKA